MCEDFSRDYDKDPTLDNIRDELNALYNEIINTTIKIDTSQEQLFEK